MLLLASLILVAAAMALFINMEIAGVRALRPRPLGMTQIGDWDGFAHPSRVSGFLAVGIIAVPHCLSDRQDGSPGRAYDRAGYGGSDAAEGLRDASNVVEELRAVLAASGHTPPYVLVGHSLGAMYVRLFARTHPEEVVGLVLVDGTPAEIFDCPASQPCGPSEESLDGEPEPGRSEGLAMVTSAQQVLAAAPGSTSPPS